MARQYCGEILKRKRVKDIKCYFVQSDNPEFRYESIQLYRNKEIEDRGRIIDKNFESTVGFAMVWKPDVIVGAIAEDFDGFKIADYEFPKMNEVPVKQLCQVMAEIIGEESKILRNSRSKEEYLSKWCLQSRFKQHHSFKL